MKKVITGNEKPFEEYENDCSFVEESFQIDFTPRTNPQISCPRSVLYLPEVIKGIQNGEIIVKISKNLSK